MRTNVIASLLSPPLLVVPLLATLASASYAGSVATSDGLRLESSDQGAVFSSLAIANIVWDLIESKTGFFIRDYRGDQRFHPLLCRAELGDGRLVLEGAQPALQVKLRAEVSAEGPYLQIRGVLQNLKAEEDRALVLKFGLGLAESDLTWSDSLLNRQRAAPGKTYGNGVTPIASVDGAKGGVTMAIPHDSPGKFRTEFADGQMAMRWDFGLTRRTTKFPNRAAFALVLYRHDPAWGFRDGLGKYYQMTPANYKQSTPRAGLWSFLMGTPFERYPEDFAFHEAGTGELALVVPWQLTPRVREMMAPVEQRPAYAAIDRDHPVCWMKATTAREFGRYNEIETTRKLGVYFFPYMTLWERSIYQLPGNSPPKDYDYQMQLFEAWNVRDVLKYDSPFPATSFNSVEELKQIIRASGLHRPDGKYDIYPFVNMGNTLAFSVNPDPDLFHDRKQVMTMGRYALQYMEMFERELPEANGFYIDRLLGRPNYRAEHFGYADYPLTFDQERPRDAVNDLFHARVCGGIDATATLQGQMADVQWNRSRAFLRAAYLDVGGTEAPPPRWDHYAWCRTALGRKPCAALERYHQHDDDIDENLKRATVFNVFYSFDPNFYILKHLTYKTESLHRRYVGVWRKLYQAGWAPVTLAQSQRRGRHAGAVRLRNRGQVLRAV